MKEKEQKLYNSEKQNKIIVPVVIAVLVIVVLIGILTWFSISDPKISNNLRDLMIVLILFSFFVVGTAAAILFFILASKIDGAKIQIDAAMSSADVTVEKLAEQITEIFKKILEPFIDAESHKAGLIHLISGKKEK